MREIGISPRFSRDKFVPLQTKQRYSTRDISGEVSLTLFFRGFVPFLSLADFVSRNKNLQVADLQRLKSCFGELVTATTRITTMTALRLGDMQHLRWCDIKMIDGVPTISIIQRKTKRPAIIPLNEMAQSLLPPRTDDNPESLVFHLVKKSDNVSKYVRRLKEKAGIEKDLTYHCSRHTTASLAISAGADISAVKDVLGHGSITSTEVYAKVALEKKIEAVNLFNGVFD